MASLLIVSGPSEGAYYPLGNRTLVIGRDEGAAVQVNDDKVSRKHVQIRRSDTGTFIALDMKSANGTRVNGRILAPEVELNDQDEIELGSSMLIFTTADFPDRESAFAQWKRTGERGKPTIVKP